MCSSAWCSVPLKTKIIGQIQLIPDLIIIIIKSCDCGSSRGLHDKFPTSHHFLKKSWRCRMQGCQNYSPALSVICQILPQILPQLQGYSGHRCLFFDISFDDVVGGGGHRSAKCLLSMHRGVSEGRCAPSEIRSLKNFVFLKLESCNLMNTFGRNFRAGNE